MLAVTVGGVIGLGILHGPGEIAEVVPEPSSYLALWLLGGMAYAAIHHRDDGFRRHSAVRDHLGRHYSGVCDVGHWVGHYRTVVGAVFVDAPVTSATELMPVHNRLNDWSLVIAMIIFTYDGWLYASYFSGKIRGGAGVAVRSCIKGMIVVSALYMLLNLALDSHSNRIKNINPGMTNKIIFILFTLRRF